MKKPCSTVIDYCAQTFERHLDGYDLVPDSLGGEKLEKHLWVLKPGGKAIGIAGPPTPR
jgi:NADPH:quinone reductase-like Zn-dependent oxidoreductase